MHVAGGEANSGLAVHGAANVCRHDVVAIRGVRPPTARNGKPPGTTGARTSGRRRASFRCRIDSRRRCATAGVGAKTVRWPRSWRDSRTRWWTRRARFPRAPFRPAQTASSRPSLRKHRWPGRCPTPPGCGWHPKNQCRAMRRPAWSGLATRLELRRNRLKPGTRRAAGHPGWCLGCCCTLSCGIHYGDVGGCFRAEIFSDHSDGGVNAVQWRFLRFRRRGLLPCYEQAQGNRSGESRRASHPACFLQRQRGDGVKTILYVVSSSGASGPVGLLRVYQSQIFENSIYVPFLRLAEHRNRWSGNGWKRLDSESRQD